MPQPNRSIPLSKIFLSYRRSDVPGSAGRLYDRLLDHFSDDDVFLDVDSIEPGADFIEAMEAAMPENAVVLVLIGNAWLKAEDSQGRRRIDRSRDFVRTEIETALRNDLRILPLLVGDAAMPLEDELPESIRPLARLNAAHLSHERFYADVDELLHLLDQYLGHAGTDTDRQDGNARRSTAGRSARLELQRAANRNAVIGRYINLVIAAALLGILGVLAWRSTNDPPEPRPAVTDTPETRGPSLAVLPFENLSDEASGTQFADGVADELLTVLARLDGLRVASRSSTFALRGENLAVPELGQRFEVNHVLAGTVRQADDRVRISAQLYDTRSDELVWAESFERGLVDVFEIQTEIATAIGGALELTVLARPASQPARQTQSPLAYSLYLQGLGQFRKRYGDALPSAVERLEEAVAADPGFARAWALLAAAYAQYNSYVATPLNNAAALGFRAARRALDANPESALAHAVLGYLLGERGQWVEARKHVDQSIELEPRDDLIRLWAAVHFLQLGELGRGLLEAQNAYDIDPESGVNNSWVAVAHSLGGAFDQSARFSRRAVERGHFVSEFARFQDLIYSDNPAAAGQLIRRSLSRFGVDSQSEAEAVVQQLAPTATATDETAPGNATLNFLLRSAKADVEPALATLRESCCAARRLMMTLMWHPVTTALRADEQFFQFLAGEGVVDYWDEHPGQETCQRRTGNAACAAAAGSPQRGAED